MACTVRANSYEFFARKISHVTNGLYCICTFDTSRRTCLQTKWSKDGIGYLLLQQYCKCKSKNVPICYPDGWRLVYAGSRFTTPTEAGYSPTEGESLAVAWALDNAKMFVLGCRDLIVSTDHKPLLGIFWDRDLSSIPNDCISSLKKKTFRYQFLIQSFPGKIWHRGPNAVSRNPSISTVSLISLIVANQHQLTILTALSLFRRAKMHSNQTNLTKNL